MAGGVWQALRAGIIGTIGRPDIGVYAGVNLRF
jgi:hypothetical protein